MFDPQNPLQSRIARYAFSVAAVTAAFALKLWFIPLTGRGAPFVMFFAAVMLTSLVAGVGPGIGAVLMAIPLGAYTFVLRAGYEISEAIHQSLLFAIDGFIVVYLTFLMRQGREAAQEATRQQQVARRQAEIANERLRESEERFRLTIEEAPIGIALVALDGRFVRVNHMLCEIVGYTADELTTLTFQAITHPDDLDKDVALAIELARGDIARYQLEKRYIRKDGSTVDILLGASILRGAHDEPLYYIVRVEDIGARKRRDEALRRAVTAREEVLGIVAHDLRNPLTSIIQSVALAQSGLEPERLRKRLDIISRAASRMDHLIQDLLDVSLIETGQLKIEPERVATADLVREAVETEAPLASSSGLEIRVDLPSHVDDVSGSRDRLHEVFDNLIGNAMKFTEAGGHITVGAVSRSGDVLFWVADTGRGIPAEKLPHVFDRFWAAVPIAGRLGPGLGLAITKGIVEAHGGRIWVESTPGSGSTFFFTIPKAPDYPAPPTLRPSLQTSVR